MTLPARALPVGIGKALRAVGGSAVTGVAFAASPTKCPVIVLWSAADAVGTFLVS